MAWWDDAAYQAYLESLKPTPVVNAYVTQAAFEVANPMINSSSRAWNPVDPTQVAGGTNAVTGPGFDKPDFPFWTMQWAAWLGATPDPYYGGYGYLW